MQLPIGKIPFYKVRYDCRVKKADGTYIRLLHQSICIQQGENRELYRTLAVDTGITHLKSEGKPTLSFIGLEGEPSYINVKVKTRFSRADDVLSKREKNPPSFGKWQVQCRDCGYTFY